MYVYLGQKKASFLVKNAKKDVKLQSVAYKNDGFAT